MFCSLFDWCNSQPSLAVRLTLREYGEQRKERRLSSQLWMLWRLLGRTCNYRTAWRCLKALRLLWIAKLMSGPQWNNHIVDIYEQMLFITNVVSIDKPINNHGSELPIGLYFIFFVHGFQPASHESHFLVSSKNYSSFALCLITCCALYFSNNFAKYLIFVLRKILRD